MRWCAAHTAPSIARHRGLDFDFENPDLGERVTQHKDLPIATVDASQGKGHSLHFRKLQRAKRIEATRSAKMPGNFLVNTREHWKMALEGRPILVRLPLRLKRCIPCTLAALSFSCSFVKLRYDFNRKPGARLIAQQMVDDLFGRP